MTAKQRMRPVTAETIAVIAGAITSLNTARNMLRYAEAGNAANYVARALKSAQCALNNARRMRAKQDREANKVTE